jgi:AcrR family transcriptional regulator
MTLVTVAGRRSGADTQSAILLAAATTFRARGFGEATLEDIADQVGITRQAVLHHFTSKEEVLRRAVRPFFDDLDRILDEYQGPARLGPHQRRAMFTQLIEMCAEHRTSAALISRDVTSHQHLGPELQLHDRSERFVALVAGDPPDPALATKAVAALGVLVRPLAAPDDVIDFADPGTRRLLVDCAMAVLSTPYRGAA